MIEILTLFYHSDGMEHVNYLMTTMFESMMKPSNVPDLMTNDKLIHNVYCSPLDFEYLQKNYTPLANSRGLEVCYYPIIMGRGNLFEAVFDQFRRAAQLDRAVILSSADWVWSGGLAATRRKIKRGQAIFSPTFRIRMSGYDQAKQFLRREHTNPEFSRLFIEEIPHKLLEISREKRWDYQWLEKVPDGWNFYHKEPVPFICWPDQWVVNSIDVPIKTIELLDHHFTQVMFNDNRIAWLTGNDDAFVGEFTQDSKYNEMIDNRYMNPAAGFFMNLPLHHRMDK